MNNLFIPTKLKIGFQNRQDTFNGKLAYVIYYDEKGKLRKEKSWLGWCDSTIPSIEIDNVPTKGFMINKGVQRSSDWFGTGRSLTRIHHPSDFEFEISIDNLIQILMHSDVSKRDIQEECVFAWSGTDLVLLPTNSVEYQTSLEYTAKQSINFSAKQLVPGHTYDKKKSDEKLVYIGYDYVYRHDYNTEHNGYGHWNYSNTAYDKNIHTVKKSKSKKHIFYNLTYNYFDFSAPSTLSCASDDNVHANFAVYVEMYQKTYAYTGLHGLALQPVVDVPKLHKDVNSPGQYIDFWLYKHVGDKIYAISMYAYYRTNTVYKLEDLRSHLKINVLTVPPNNDFSGEIVYTSNHWFNWFTGSHRSGYLTSDILPDTDKEMLSVANLHQSDGGISMVKLVDVLMAHGYNNNRVNWLSQSGNVVLDMPNSSTNKKPFSLGYSNRF